MANENRFHPSGNVCTPIVHQLAVIVDLPDPGGGQHLSETDWALQFPGHDDDDDDDDADDDDDDRDREDRDSNFSPSLLPLVYFKKKLQAYLEKFVLVYTGECDNETRPLGGGLYKVHCNSGKLNWIRSRTFMWELFFGWF